MINGLTDANSLTSYIFANSASNNSSAQTSQISSTDSSESFDSILKAQDSSENDKTSNATGEGSDKSTEPMDLNGDGTVSIQEMLQFISSQQSAFQSNHNESGDSSNFLETLFNRSQFENAYKQAANFVSNTADSMVNAYNAVM